MNEWVSDVHVVFVCVCACARMRLHTCTFMHTHEFSKFLVFLFMKDFFPWMLFLY